MADTETPQEASSEESVAPASATPEKETPPDNVSTSDFQAGLEALEERVVNRLKQSTGAKVKAAVSSEMDGRLSGFDETVALLREHLPEDLDLEAIKERQFVRGLMQQPTSDTPEVEPEAPSQAEVPEVATSPPGRESEIAAILETHGLKNAPPELLEYAEANKNEPWWKVGAGFEKLASEIAARSAGTPAGVVATQGQAANPDLIQEFRKELNALLNPVDSEGKHIPGQRLNMNQLRTLQQKHRELGVSEEDLDINPTGGVEPGFGLRDWAPPA